MMIKIIQFGLLMSSLSKKLSGNLVDCCVAWLLGCVILVLQMLRYCCAARLCDCCVKGCVIVVLQGCMIVLLRSRLRDCCVARLRDGAMLKISAT
jgi:hypothetical protein